METPQIQCHRFKGILTASGISLEKLSDMLGGTDISWLSRVLSGDIVMSEKLEKKIEKVLIKEKVPGMPGAIKLGPIKKKAVARFNIELRKNLSDAEMESMPDEATRKLVTIVCRLSIEVALQCAGEVIFQAAAEYRNRA